MRSSLALLAVSGLTLGLAGCDKLGLEDPAQVAARIEAEGKAIGAACRHAGRAIEDCYQMNSRASKSAIFDGWREMNDYMTEKQIAVVKPVLSNIEEKAAEKSAAEHAPKAEEKMEKPEVKAPPEEKPAQAETAAAAEPVKKPRRVRKAAHKEVAPESKPAENLETSTTKPHEPNTGEIKK